jgi:hypothetical protein
MTVKLYAPEHPEGCHIALTNGHTFLVPHEPAGVEVPTLFRKEAIARGCLPVGMAPEPEGEPETFDRDRRIRDEMRKMMDSDDPGAFLGDGKPNLTKLSTLCGFQVQRSERDRLWAEVETDLNKDDD